jgi:predicted nucleotidyltransferase component of viral defense system
VGASDMIISTADIEEISISTGFQYENVEKVIRLYSLLNTFSEDKFLRDKFSFKGGTALNAFYSKMPRLSVDIDLNYIGEKEKQPM